MDHQVDHGDLDHAFTALCQCLVVFRQSAVLSEPREGTLDDPSLRQHDESVQLRALDDFHRAEEPPASPVHELSRVAAVGKDQSQSVKALAQLGNDKSPAVAVLDVGWMNDQRHDQSERVDEDVPLAARDLLACIEALVIDRRPPFAPLWRSGYRSRRPTGGPHVPPLHLRP